MTVIALKGVKRRLRQGRPPEDNRVIMRQGEAKNTRPHTVDVVDSVRCSQGGHFISQPNPPLLGEPPNGLLCRKWRIPAGKSEIRTREKINYQLLHFDYSMESGFFWLWLRAFQGNAVFLSRVFAAQREQRGPESWSGTSTRSELRCWSRMLVLFVLTAWRSKATHGKEFGGKASISRHPVRNYCLMIMFSEPFLSVSRPLLDEKLMEAVPQSCARVAKYFIDLTLLEDAGGRRGREHVGAVVTTLSS